MSAVKGIGLVQEFRAGRGIPNGSFAFGCRLAPGAKEEQKQIMRKDTSRRRQLKTLLSAGLLGLFCNIAAGQDSGTLIQTIDTSALVPPSPDPAGITYNDFSGRLIFSDSEVNEMSIFSGVNLFDIDTFGTLINIGVTTDFSDEPTGVAFNPFNGHLFISDDDDAAIYEVAPGPDGLYGTGDDSFTSFSTLGLNPPSTDPEDVAFDPVDNALFIVDGVGSQFYRLEPGPNGIFDGVQPIGDDIATVNSTLSFGLRDPEGIAVGTGDLRGVYLVGEPENTVFHFTTSGAFIRTIDIGSVAVVQPSGLAFGPGSNSPSNTSLYITDRGIDNGDDPLENDGKIYEFVIPSISNFPPEVDAGGDQSRI